MVARSGLCVAKTWCAPWLLAAAVISIGCSALLATAGELTYTGVNLSGAEFGMAHLPGVYNGVGSGPYDYIYPTSQEVNYYTNKGMNTFRLPFRWERMQKTPNATLDATELSRMDGFVNYATSKGDYVLIEPQNFQRYYPLSSNFESSNEGLIGGTVADTQTSYNNLNGTGSSANVLVTNGMFANFWGQMADHYKNNSHVFFDLMNEPNNVSASSVVSADNAAFAAIRATGANNLVLVEGINYTGAQTWLNSGNASAMLGIVDSGNNYAFEMHQYFSGSGGGYTINNNDPTTGVQRLQSATAWLQTNHLRGFLGEFAVDNSLINASKADTTTLGNATIVNTLNYLQANSNVWMGWCWWGGGPWWGNYPFGLDPSNINNPTDVNAMYPLSRFLPTAGDFNRDGHVDATDISAMQSALTDLNGWYATMTTAGLNSTQEKIIADVNKDGLVNNADLQKLLNIIATGGGSTSAVPEPASAVLAMAMFGCLLLVRRSTSMRR